MNKYAEYLMFSFLLQYFYLLTAVDELFLKHRHVIILLDGLDTVGDVKLNGMLLMSTRNMFQRFVIDVTDIIKVYIN